MIAKADSNTFTLLSVIISTASSVLQIGPPGNPFNHPLIAFDHLSLYIQKDLGQSMALRGILWKGISLESWEILGDSWENLGESWENLGEIVGFCILDSTPRHYQLW